MLMLRILVVTSLECCLSWIRMLRPRLTQRHRLNLKTRFCSVQVAPSACSSFGLLAAHGRADESLYSHHSQPEIAFVPDPSGTSIYHRTCLLFDIRKILLGNTLVLVMALWPGHTKASQMKRGTMPSVPQERSSQSAQREGVRKTKKW